MRNEKYIEEYKDMFNKFNIIKKINPNYRLCFDKLNKLFIIINSANHNEICLKFSNFSLNIEKMLQETKIENLSKIVCNIENNNKILEQKRSIQARNELEVKMNELIQYSSRTNRISASDINKIVGVKNA